MKSKYVNEMFDRIGYAVLNGTWKGLWSVPTLCVLVWFISAHNMHETIPFLMAFIMAVAWIGFFISISLNRWRSDR